MKRVKKVNFGVTLGVIIIALILVIALFSAFGFSDIFKKIFGIGYAVLSPSGSNVEIGGSGTINELTCGNGMVDDGEQCDGTLFAETTESNCVGGVVTCSSKCMRDYSQCLSYPACFGQYEYIPGVASSGLCDQVFNQEECEQFNNWGNNCIWNPTEERCSGPVLTCQDMKLADSCNALGGCGWVEEPGCGNGELNYDEECDANQFFWYDDSISGHFTSIGDLVESTCADDIYQKIYGGYLSEDFVKCEQCKMVPAQC